MMDDFSNLRIVSEAGEEKALLSREQKRFAILIDCVRSHLAFPAIEGLTNIEIQFCCIIQYRLSSLAMLVWSRIQRTWSVWDDFCSRQGPIFCYLSMRSTLDNQTCLGICDVLSHDMNITSSDVFSKCRLVLKKQQFCFMMSILLSVDGIH